MWRGEFCSILSFKDSGIFHHGAPLSTWSLVPFPDRWQMEKERGSHMWGCKMNTSNHCYRVFWHIFHSSWGGLYHFSKCSLPHPGMPHPLAPFLGRWLLIFTLLNSSMSINYFGQWKVSRSDNSGQTSLTLDRTVMGPLLPLGEANKCLAVWTGKKKRLQMVVNPKILCYNN